MNKIEEQQQFLKPSLIAIAITQALVTIPIQAATINVDPPPGGCTLFKAISTANSNVEFAPCVKGVGNDTINLPANETFNLYAGPFDGGLPIINTTITINGNGSTIRRHPTSATGSFRLLTVSNGNLTLDSITLMGGEGGGLFASDSTISITNSKILDNFSLLSR